MKRNLLAILVTCGLALALAPVATASDGDTTPAPVNQPTDSPTDFEESGEFVLVDSRNVTKAVEDPITGEIVELNAVEETWAPRTETGEDPSQPFVLQAGVCSVTRAAVQPWRSNDGTYWWAWGQGTISVSSGCSDGVNGSVKLFEKIGLAWWTRAGVYNIAVSPGQSKTRYAIYNCTGHGTDQWKTRTFATGPGGSSGSSVEKSGSLTCP
jgi:hypothetical protein